MNQNNKLRQTNSNTTHRRMQTSTTLNRRYVRRPHVTTTSTAPVKRPATNTARPVRRPAPARPAPAIKQPATPATIKTTAPQSAPKANTDSVTKKHTKTSIPKKRFITAVICAAVCIIALACVIKLNIPNVSVQVAAMQSGIEASYPSYLPQDFSLSSVSAENNQVRMEFKGNDDKSFQLTEEKSSWDSNALLNNYVKTNWQENYSIAREQGITIYVSGSNATWVNGGILYHIFADSDVLTKKQIYNIVTSL